MFPRSCCYQTVPSLTSEDGWDSWFVYPFSLSDRTVNGVPDEPHMSLDTLRMEPGPMDPGPLDPGPLGSGLGESAAWWWWEADMMSE